MKKLFLLAMAFCAVAISGNNLRADIVDVTFDVSGIASVDFLGDPDNVLGFIDLGAGFDNYHVIGIGWDVTLTAFGGSWLSEISVNFVDGGVTLTPGFGDDFPGGPTPYSSGGVVDLVGVALDWNQASNITNLEFFESFDDVGNADDGIWDSGLLTVRVERTVVVPEPGTAALLGVCLLVGGVASRRRRV